MRWDPSEAGEGLRPRRFSSLLASRVALILMFAASAVGVQASTPSQAGAMTLAQVDGGPDYYARFSHGLPTKESYFPIGVWLRTAESQAHFDAYADFGVNLFVGVENPEGANEALIRQAGMRTLIQADERTRFNNIGSENAGWLTSDEVDMTHGPGGGPAHIADILAGLPQDGKIRYSNYGQGVLFWETDDRGRSVRQPVPADRLHRPLLVHLPQARR